MSNYLNSDIVMNAMFLNCQEYVALTERILFYDTLLILTPDQITERVALFRAREIYVERIITLII